MQETQQTQVQSLSWEDPLEKETATLSSILAWKIPRTEEPGGYSPWGRKELDTTEHIHSHTHTLTAVQGGRRESKGRAALGNHLVVHISCSVTDGWCDIWQVTEAF